MYPTIRALAALFFFLALVMEPARGGGEYQGYEPLPHVIDIRFNPDAIGFRVANNSFVPGGERYFEIPRGAADWQRISSEGFTARFPSRRLPSSNWVKDGKFLVLSTTDGAHLISTNYQCMEGSAHWAGVRRNGDWFPTHAKQCVNIGAIESVGPWLLLGTSYVGEAGMFYGAQGIVAVDKESGELKQRIDFSERLRESGMIVELRRDPFTNEVWAATLSGLLRISPQLEVEARYWFADQFDEQSRQTVTRLVDKPAANDPLAQYVRAMNIDAPGAVLAFMKVQCTQDEHRDCGSGHMYNLGMSSGTNWSNYAGANALLPHFVTAAAYGNNGQPSVMFIEELAGFRHPCTESEYTDLHAYKESKRTKAMANALECFKAAGIQPVEMRAVREAQLTRSEPPLVPSTTTFSAPSREAYLRQDDGSFVYAHIHTAWVGWQGGINESGEYGYTQRCLDFDTVEVGDDGYYRFDARTFTRDGDWVGAENLYAIESSEWREKRSYGENLFDLPPRSVEPAHGQISSELERLIAQCREDGVQNAQMDSAILRTQENKLAIEVKRDAARQAARERAQQQQLSQPVQILKPELRARSITVPSDDPRVLQMLRNKGIEIPPEIPNPLIEQMKRKKQEQEQEQEAKQNEDQ